MATVIRVTGGDFAAAEEVVQDAFEAAVRQCPLEGVPVWESAPDDTLRLLFTCCHPRTVRNLIAMILA